MKQSFEDLVNLMKKLRAPGGCAWDREQTFETIKTCMLDEANEVAEAIDKKDHENLKEELGDLLYNIIFLTEIAEEKELFHIKDVMDHVNEKIVRRHPHVFGDEKCDDPEKILERWHEIKVEEKKNAKKSSDI